VPPAPAPWPLEQDSRNLALESLVLNISLGDTDALGAFYRQNVGFVYSIARNILRLKEDAEEVVCDVFSAVWQNAKNFDRARGNVLAWLATMARNRAIDQLRKRKQHVSPDTEMPALRCDTPEDILDLFQQGSAVHDALAQLSPICRLMVAMSFFQDLSHQEMANKLSLPLGTVKSRLRRPLAAMRTTLERPHTAHSESEPARIFALE
jgi:RNA polymerase sigma-70 factor (ECF subfamily)